MKSFDEIFIGARNIRFVDEFNKDDIPVGWIPYSERHPDDYTDVMLLCQYMMCEYEVIGQLAYDERIKSDVDPDLFFRSAVKAWRPLND